MSRHAETRIQRRSTDPQMLQAMRWPLVLLGVAVVVVVVVAAVLVLRRISVGQVDLRYTVQISGLVVDGEAGEPVSGAWIVPCRSASPRSRTSAAARLNALRANHGKGRPLPGGGVSGADGSFSFAFEIGWVARKTIWGDLQLDGRPPPFHDVKALLVEFEGRRVVFDTKSGAWLESKEGDVFATLDVGEVRLPRE